MGVTGSHCQLCCLPLHHDHYVFAAGGSGMLKIYRTRRPGGGHDFEPGEAVVPFAREHAWLCEAVAIPRMGNEAQGVLIGTVEDGVLTDRDSTSTAFIWKGDENALAYHRWCWERMGSPQSEADCVRAHGLHAWGIVDTYRGQLFEHLQFREHGYGWMLVDPVSSERSRARIDGMLARAKARPALSAEPYPTVRELVTGESGWTGMIMRDESYTAKHAIHYREDLHRELDTTNYPTLVWAMNEYGEPGMPNAELLQDLANYESGLIAAVERDDTAIVLMTTLGTGQTQYLIQSRDEALTKRAIAALPTPAGTSAIAYDNESDPTWKNFFETMDPRLHR
jgi:Family of unknown function (DUF695)